MGYRISKRLFDIVSAICGIIFFALPWLLIAVIIKKKSPGPVLFKPRRVGLYGKEFTLYKFRSMRVNSGAIHTTTLRGDERIFPFGEFLRKSKLDETPQLINILKNDMSVIGPRPEDLINAKKIYKGRFSEILSVKPGLSSPASLYDYTHGEFYENEALYNEEFLPRKLELELYYVNNKNFIYDLQIVWRTIVTIMQIMLGKDNFAEPDEMKNIRNMRE